MADEDVLLDADNVLFVEQSSPWGVAINPQELSLRDLRLHLHARGYHNTAGSRGELVVILAKVLEHERQEAWEERQRNLSRSHLRLRHLVKSIEKDDKEFELARANVWKKEYEDADAWDWKLDPRSLHVRERQERAQYQLKSRARQKRRAQNEQSLEEKAARERLEKMQRLKEQRRRELEKKFAIKEERCAYREHIDGKDFHCVNERMAGAGGTLLRTCPFHTTLCVNEEAHRRSGEKDAGASDSATTSTMKISCPNERGMCTDCYKSQCGRFPLKFDRHRCPGVHEVNSGAVAQLALTSDSALHGDSSLSESSKHKGRRKTCKWKFVAKDGREYKCTNATRTPAQTVCGYHTTRCDLLHPGVSPKIKVPNSLGMCPSHFTAKTGIAPEDERKTWPKLHGRLVPPGVVWIKPVVQEKREHTLRPRSAKRPNASSSGAIKGNLLLNNDEEDNLALARAREKTIPGVMSVLKVVSDSAASQRLGQLRASVLRRFASRKIQRLHEQLQESIREQKKVQKRSLLGFLYARKIQRWFRGCRGRAQAKQAWERRMVRVRWDASVLIQAQARGVVWRGRVAKYQRDLMLATDLLQRVVRGHIARKDMRLRQAAQVIQRVTRGFLCRLSLVAQGILRALRARRSDTAWAQFLLIRALKRYIRRFRERKAFEQWLLERKAAAAIQAIARGVSTRKRQQTKILTRKRTVRAASRIQLGVRVYLRGRRELKEEEDTTWACVVIQACWRSFRARIRANFEREANGKAWKWLDAERPQTAYDHLLPQSTYGDPIASNGDTQFWMDRNKVRIHDLLEGVKMGPPASASTSTFSKDEDVSQGNQSARSTSSSGNSSEASATTREDFHSLWSKVPFLKYDPILMGRIKRYEFGLALRQMGYRISETQIGAILRRWSRYDGTVDYMSFLEYVKQESFACEKHRAYACPQCVSYGPCIKCNCRCYKAQGKQSTKRTVCSCGHYVAMHNMIPKLRTGKTVGSSSEALSKAELKRMLAPPAQPELPIGIQGTTLESTGLKIEFNQADLRVRADTVHGASVVGANRRQRPSTSDLTTSLRVVPASHLSKLQATKAFQKLGERIIENITDESKSIIEDLKHTGDWEAPGTEDTRTASTAKPRLRRRPGSRGRPGTTSSRPNTTNASASKRRAVVDALEKEEQLATKAETCSADQVGRMLLKSSARPHTSTVSTSSGSSSRAQTPAYVKRAVQAGKKRKEEREKLLAKRQWTNPREFARGFKVTDPVPLIINDTLRIEHNTVPLYIDTLLAFASEECGLLEDWGAFVAYVFQSFSFLDRHWRKLVFDIRTGTLDVNLPVDNDTRAQVERAIRPNPDRARVLDRYMQQLGFYKVCSGHGGSAKPGGSNSGSNSNNVSSSSPRALNRPKSGLLETLKKGVDKSKSEKARLEKRQTVGNLAENEQPISEELLKSLEGFQTSVELSLDTRVEAEKVKAITTLDVYDLHRRPRIVPNPVLRRDSRKIRKYVCSFPGCSKAFAMRQLAERHALEEHVGKFRLAQDLTDVDERMQVYWPKHAPWTPVQSKRERMAREKHGIGILFDEQEEDRLAEQERKAFYPFRCSRASCDKRFHTKKEVKAHVMAQHERSELLHDMVGGVAAKVPWMEPTGLLARAPPAALPPGVHVTCCSKHWVLLQPRCRECQAIISRGNPICPLELFSGAVLHGELKLSVSSRTVVHVKHPQLAREHIGRVSAIFSDKFARLFVAYSTYEPGSSADPDQLRVVPNQVLIAPLANITGTSFVLHMEQAEFAQRVSERSLPAVPRLRRLTPKETESKVYYCPPHLDEPPPTENGTFKPLVKRLRGILIDDSEMRDKCQAMEVT